MAVGIKIPKFISSAKGQLYLIYAGRIRAMWKEIHHLTSRFILKY